MPKQGRIYKWRPGSTFRVDAQTAGEYIEELREEQEEGVLTPTALYEAAQDPDSPIHEEFEWDERKAAEAHWRDRAGNLMRHLAVVRVRTEEASDGIPAFMSVRVTTGTRGYVDAEQVYSVDEYRSQTVAQALSMLNGLKMRFGKLEELNIIWKAIETAEKRREKAALKKS